MKKNVLIFGHSYATQFIDISNQYTCLFDPQKYQVTVVYLTGGFDHIIKKRHVAEEVIFLNAPKNDVRGLKLKSIRKMKTLTAEKNFEIVICHRYKPTYIMMWVALSKKFPIFISVMHELGTLNKMSRRILFALFFPKNSYLAGVSDAVCNDLQKSAWRIPKTSMITLHNMIDVDMTEPQLLTQTEARAQLKISQESFIFGTIGRLAKNKDHQTLIKAFSMIKPHCPHSKLLIIGDGHLEKNLKKLVHALNLQQDVIFTGFVTEGYRFIKAMNVFLLPSIQEAFGRVLLEAMLAKIPVIATRVNGIPEVLGNTNFLTEPANPNQLAEKMLYLFHTSREQLNTHGIKGYERVLENFSIYKFNEIFWNLPNVAKGAL